MSACALRLIVPLFCFPFHSPTTAEQAPAPTSPSTAQQSPTALGIIGRAADWNYIGYLMNVGQDLAHMSSRNVDEENVDEEGLDLGSKVIDQQGRAVPPSITPSGLICVGEGVDAVAECRREQAMPSADYSRDSPPKGRAVSGLANRNKTYDVSEEHINQCCSTPNAPTSVTPTSELPSGAPKVQPTTVKSRQFPEELLQTAAGGAQSPAVSACGNPDLARAPAARALEFSEATPLKGLVEPADVDDADAADMVGLFQAVLPGTPTGEARQQILKSPV
jgi:hypothetical protein